MMRASRSLLKNYGFTEARSSITPKTSAAAIRISEAYMAQREHKVAQFEKMLAYCESASCRMMSLVRYFGDSADSRRPCGVCDFCDPSSAAAQTFRPPTQTERVYMAQILEALESSDGISAGRLYTEAFPSGGLDRRGFEDLMNGMARAALVQVIESSFEKDGRRIEFRKVRAMPEAFQDGALDRVSIPVEAIGSGKKPAKRKKRAKSRVPTNGVVPPPSPVRAQSPLREQMKAWRAAEAKKAGVPAFRIFSDRVLDSIIAARPANVSELLGIGGVGPRLIEKYGAQILRVLR